MTKYLLSLLFFSIIVSANKSNKPSAYTLPNQYIKKISLQTLNSKSSSIQIPMLNNKMAFFSIKNKISYLNGDYSFESKTSDSKGYISATMGENSVFGQMHYDNKHYILTTEKSGSWIIELPENGMTYNSCGFKGKHQDTLKKDVLKSSNKAGPGQYSVIDLLFVYNQAMADRYPGDLLQTRLNQYLYVANQSSENSKINLKFRNVATEQIAYDLNNDNFIARNDINASLQGNTVAGMENIKQLREANGADIVVFFRPHDIEKRGSCGIAYFPTIDAVGKLDPNYGVHVISDGMDSWSICTDEVMIHELGHNLGASHHNTPKELRFREDGSGFAKLGQFTTIMGSFGTGQPERFFELGMFSNPNLQCGGERCGSYNESDNASVIKSLKNIVSEYQDDKSTVPIPETFEKIDVDHDSDGFVDSVDAFPFDSSQHSDADKDGVGDVNDAFPNNASEQLDTDNDGIGNNQDSDDDGDGIDDFADFYPLDNTKTRDSDYDGKDDNSDAFPNNNREWNDFDHDLIGDNLDTDDDNDGFIDADFNQQDVLILSLGNNRILRFDAVTGEAKGIEVISNDGLLTYQSDLTYSKEEQRLFYTSESAVKSIDLNRTTQGIIIHPYPENEFQIKRGISYYSGFPTSLLSFSDQFSNLFLIVPVLHNYLPRIYSGFGKYFYTYISVLDNIKNIIAITKNDSVIYYLDQPTVIYSGDGIYPSVLNTNSQNWAKDPFAIAVSSDDRLFVTNQESNKIESINSENGDYLGTFADISSQGYSNPTGIAITDNNIMLVAASDQSAVLKFNVVTGEYLGELVSGHGLENPHKMILVPQLNDRFPHDAQKVIRPNAGLWYNPETSGRGFDIQVFNNSLSVIWYTFDEQGLPTWYISSGELNGFEYTGTFQKTHLNPDASVTVKDAGSINIHFNSERQAQINWTIGNNQGTEAIKWLYWGAYEEEINNYTGLWGRPDGPGWGVSVATLGKKSIAVPYIYDSNGEPRWLISSILESQSPLTFELSAVFSDTLCPSCSGVSSATVKPAGTMRLDLSGDKNWNSSIQFPAPITGDWPLNDTEIKLFSSAATRPR